MNARHLRLTREYNGYARPLASWLGAFGDPIPADQAAQVSAVIDKTVASLQDAWDKLSAYLASNPISVPRETIAAGQSALSTLQSIITRLGGSSKADVLQGSETIDQWLGAAQTVLQGITDQANLVQAGSYVNLATAQMSDAYQQLKDLGTKAGNLIEGAANVVVAGASWFDKALPWLAIGGVAVVGLVYLPSILGVLRAGKGAIRSGKAAIDEERARRRRSGPTVAGYRKHRHRRARR